MALPALIALAIIPAGLYMAAQNDSHRKRRKWQKQGPLPVSRPVAVAPSLQPIPAEARAPLKGHLHVFLLDVVPPEEAPLGLGTGMGVSRAGVRLFDPFLVLQMGRDEGNYQRSSKTAGLFNTAKDTTIPLHNAAFHFALPQDHPRSLGAFLYGKKRKGKLWEERLMAVGSIPLGRALRQGDDLCRVPLTTRKGVNAGYLRVALKFEVILPQPFVATEEDDVESLSRLRVDSADPSAPPIVVFSAGCQPSIAVPEGSRSDGRE